MLKVPGRRAMWVMTATALASGVLFALLFWAGDPADEQDAKRNSMALRLVTSVPLNLI